MNNFFFHNLIKNCIAFSVIFLSYSISAFSEPGISTFMYHRFGENKFPSTNVRVEQFDAHIDYILNSKIKILDLSEVIKMKENNLPFNEKAVAFSVDDAYSSFYEIAWPIFRDNNIPVTLFVSTDIIDNNTKGYMSWEDIANFIYEGGNIGQHTSRHIHLPLNSNSLIKKDILESHKSFIKNIGYIPKLFAYPYGESSLEVIEILKEFGITHAFGQHSGVISSNDNIYYLPRFSLNERFGDLNRFEFAVNAHSLEITDFLPSNMFLEKEKRPIIEFSLLNDLKGSPIECFSNPGGMWNLQSVKNIKPNRLQIQLTEEYKTGRARLNCTTRIDDEWHWFGYQFLVK